MHRITTFFARLKTASLKRLFDNAEKAAKQSGRLKISIVIDMVWCVFRYGVGYLDYLVFGFQFIRGKKRKTFMTFNDNVTFVRAYNQKEARENFENKSTFCNVFKDYIGREVIDLTDKNEKDFEQFLKGKKDLFAKEPTGFGGLSVKHISLAGEVFPKQLYESLRLEGLTDVEDGIVQCDELNKLCPDSVNTIRVVTILSDKNVDILYAILRVGFGKTKVDNISSGGMYAPIDLESGEVYADAFCDKTGSYYEKHPMTDTKFVGFKIPKFDEIKQLVAKASKVIPDVKYVGWDVAVSDKGPVLVEGNTLPSYDMCQNYHHLREQKTGILPRFKEIIEKNEG